jgi:Permuted papain-like amidase enzyme, YaeF/YiiX, C92 family
MWKFGKFVALAAFLIVLALYSWLGLTSVSAKNLPPLQNGDIVFQTSRSSQSAAILLASLSAYSHMGIVQLDGNGAPFVVEAVGPVKTTPLDEWIDRGLGKRIVVKRLKSLTPEASKLVLQAAHKYEGLPYDIFFLSTKDQIYCSELVSLAFDEGASIALGKFQKAKELYLDNFAAMRLIKNRWQRHPLCQSTSQNFESCYAKILEQELITPASIFSDAKLDLVYSNYKVIP